MSHETLIDNLGGSGAVSQALGVATPVVANWRRRGVPWRWRLAIVRLAETKGVTLPQDFMPPEPAQ